LSDAEIWSVIERELLPSLDDADDLLDRMYQRFPSGEPLKRYPVKVVADFYRELKPVFPESLHPLIDQYTRFWLLGEGAGSLQRLFEHRRELILRSETDSRFLIHMQFLDSKVSWETQQDGVFFYICWDILVAGVDVKKINAALKLVFARHK
jgi:hypothetical protein